MVGVGVGVQVIGSWGRRWAAGWLVLGAVAFVFVPLVAPNASAAEGGEARELDAPYSSPADVPGLSSEPFMEPLKAPEVERGEVDLPTVPEGGPKLDPDAKVLEEVVESRTAFSQSFRRSDGLLEVRASAQPVAFRSESGKFELIDTSVSETKQGLAATKNSFQVLFGDSGRGVTVVLESGERVVSRPAALDGVAPERTV